jgi:hypothetical protein
MQTFSALFNQWVSHDNYVADSQRKELEAGSAASGVPAAKPAAGGGAGAGGKPHQPATPIGRSPTTSRPQTAKGKKKLGAGGGAAAAAAAQDKLKLEPPNLSSLSRAARVMERMINQNVFDSVTLGKTSQTLDYPKFQTVVRSLQLFTTGKVVRCECNAMQKKNDTLIKITFIGRKF